MRSLLRYVTLVTLVVGVACDQATAPPGPGIQTVSPGPNAAISDAENGGRAGFYFLPPLVPDPSPFPGTFDATRQPTAAVCALNAGGTACQGGAIMTFPFGAGGATSISVDLAGQSYNATWTKPDLELGSYRLEVYDVVAGFGQQLLGYLDIQVVANSKGLKTVAPGFVGLVRKSPLSIKFRIENGAVGVVTVAPATATILVGDTQAFTATVYDLDGNVMASPPTVTWASSAPSIATVSSSGLATGVGGGTTFIRATSGGVTGQSELTVVAEVAPSVTTTVPADNATDVATGSNVSITFNEPVNVTGDWFEIACGTSGTRTPSVAGSVVVSGGPTTFSLDPATDFTPGESCTVTVFAAQVTDQDANDPPDNMAANYVFSFSMTDIAPSVTSTTPAHQATDVAKNTNITVNFSESVNVSASSFTLSCGGTQTFQLTGTSPGTSFTLTPDADLPGNTECTLTVVASEVTDADAVDPPDNMSANHVVTFTTQPDAAAPDAKDDDFAMSVAATLNGDLTTDNGHGADNLGSPAATLTSFGGGSLGGTVESNAAGAAVALAGGTLTVNGNGTFSLAAPTTAGTYTFLYRLTNGTGTDDATVTIVVRQAPDAKDDALNVLVNGTLNANVFSDNGSGADILGTPAATLTSFGGGSLGGTVESNAAGAAVALAGGTLTVNADGTLSLATPTTTGAYTFQYRLTNDAGTDDATVTIEVRRAPDAKNDAFTVASGGSLNGDLTADNGSGADDLGFPAATVTSFGNGSLGGTVTSNAAGASVGLAGGTLTVNANGSFSLATPTAAGVYTFSYRLTNAAGTDDATVTITVTGPPVAVDDAPATNSVPGDALHGAINTTFTLAAPGLLTNDNLGVPAGTITKFGKIQMVGTVDDNNAGAAATFLSTGSLTVNANGSVSLTPPNGFTGYVIFEYRVENTAGSDVGMATIAIGHRPVPDNDTYPTALVGNVKINTAKAGGTGFTVLTGDVGDAVTLAVTGPATNGDVVLNADGTFTFNPAAGFSNGNASFSYTLTNGFGTSAAATVTIPVANNLLWFVDNSGAAGDGRLGTPLNALTSLNAANGSGDADDPGDHIFLYTGNASYAGGLVLENTQRLIGQGATAALETVAGVTLPLDVENFPTTNGTRPTLVNAGGNGVSVASGNTLRGFNLGNASGSAIFGASFGTLAILDLGINTTGQAINLAIGTLTATLGGVTSTGGANNVFLSGITASGTVALGTGALSGATGAAFTIAGASSGSFDYDGTIAGNGGAAVALGGTASLSLSGNVSQAGAFPLVLVSAHTTGTLEMTGQLVATNGTGLQFNNADGTYNLGAVTAGSSLGGGDAGIDIVAGSSGTFTFGSNLSISNPSGTAFVVAASAATVTMNGAIGQNAGKRGVFLENNTGGTVTFTGLLTLSTTTANAFEATTAGPGATGTVVVQTATANALVTTTGTALRINNVNIGAGGLTFRSISANGAANGIVLANTGSSGSLIVTGNGGSCTSVLNCTGGAIQNVTQNGISLTSTLSPSFTRVAIQNAGRSGIEGQQVTNFTLANSFIDNVGTAAAGQHEESNIAFNDAGAFTTSSVSGTVSITNNLLTNARRHGIQIENGTGTISNLTVTGNALTSSTNAAVSLGTAILVLTQGSAGTTAHLTTGSISNNTITNFPSGEGIAILGGSGNGGNNTSATLGANGTPITISGNAIAGQAAAASHLGSNAIRASFNGQVGVSNFTISNNGTAGSPITNIQGQGISVFMGGSVTGTTTINNNFIVANQTLGAGTQGLAVQIDDGPAALGTSAADYNMVITNNSVSNYEGFGIRAIARASLGKMDVTIQNNSVGTPILANRNGIRIDAGSAVGDVTVCLNISGNSSDGSGVNQGIGLRKQGTVPTTNDFGIVGLTPSPTTGANAAARVAADNPAGGGVDIISGDNFTGCTTSP